MHSKPRLNHHNNIMGYDWRLGAIQIFRIMDYSEIRSYDNTKYQ